MTVAREICLDGDWQLTGHGPAGETLALPARVPGNVHPDLQRAGHIADPFWRTQADDCQWVENWEWRYAREFMVGEEFAGTHEWVVLRFDGLDTFATILLNGEEIGRAANMFIAHEFEVGGRLRAGVNRLEVRFVPVLRAVADKPYRKFAKSTAFNFTGERVYARKMQCAFGWDWVHRLVTAGVWQGVTLRRYAGARIDDVYARTVALDELRAELAVEVTVVHQGRDGSPSQSLDFSGKNVLRQETLSRKKIGTGSESHPYLEDERLRRNGIRVRVEIIAPGGGTVAGGIINDERPGTPLRLIVPDPQWWWPVGYGAQPLYACRVTLLDAADGVLDERTVEIGLRTVALEEIPDEHGSSFTLVVNGTRVFCQGGNWVPADPFPSQVTPERYERLIGHARDARLVLLRAWGGGIYEPPAFWHACNRMGVMVSQDFLFACAAYPEDDPEFVEAVRVELTAAIKALRNHPSLAFWCGDNELGLGNRPGEDWSLKKMHAELTGPLCARLDPSRPYRPTSPYGGDPNNSPLVGDMHTNSMFQRDLVLGDMRDYRAYVDAMTGRFMSEYAASGSPPLRTLRRFMTDADLTDAGMWEYHTKTNPHSGSNETLFQTLEQDARKLYGHAATPAQYVRHLEYVQYEFIRLAMESARRRKYQGCSGIQFWMYNDCWPAAGWSVLDYWGDRKAGWYGLASGCKPVIAALDLGNRDVFRWWVCNGTPQDASGQATVFVQGWRGAARWRQAVDFSVPANSARLIAEIPRGDVLPVMGLDSVLVCEIRSDRGKDRAWYFDGLPSGMEPPPATLRVIQEDNAKHGKVTVSTDHYARVVTLEAAVDFEDNYFELLPGETRTIGWKNPAGEHLPGPVGVTCWNDARGK